MLFAKLREDGWYFTMEICESRAADKELFWLELSEAESEACDDMLDSQHLLEDAGDKIEWHVISIFTAIVMQRLGVSFSHFLWNWMLNDSQSEDMFGSMHGALNVWDEAYKNAEAVTFLQVPGGLLSKADSHESVANAGWNRLALINFAERLAAAQS